MSYYFMMRVIFNETCCRMGDLPTMASMIIQDLGVEMICRTTIPPMALTVIHPTDQIQIIEISPCPKCPS